jgi:hypothetical protein
MPAWMSGTEGNWYFDFPSQNGVHYVYKVAPAIRVGQTITMHFAITGKGNFVPTEGNATARVRLFLQQRGDMLTAQEPYKRWWSVTYIELRVHADGLVIAGPVDFGVRPARGRGAERVQRCDIPARECWIYVRRHVRRPWRLCHGRERPLYTETILSFAMSPRFPPDCDDPWSVGQVCGRVADDADGADANSALG